MSFPPSVFLCLVFLTWKRGMPTSKHSCKGSYETIEVKYSGQQKHSISWEHPGARCLTRTVTWSGKGHSEPMACKAEPSFSVDQSPNDLLRDRTKCPRGFWCRGNTHPSEWHHIAQRSTHLLPLCWPKEIRDRSAPMCSHVVAGFSRAVG